MKRIFKNPEAPEALREFAEQYPDETWEHFRRANRRGYREVKKQLLEDQHGLCAYCEINIKFADEEGEVDDFRVEHFYPKSETDFAGRTFWVYATAAASRTWRMRRCVFRAARLTAAAMCPRAANR